jgi:hypothetical protein
MNTSHLIARDVEAYALSSLTVAPRARSQQGQDHRSTYSPLGRRGSRMKASAELSISGPLRFPARGPWRQSAADVYVVCLVAGGGLAMTGLFVALGYGAELGQALAMA